MKDILYKSTRDDSIRITASQAILQGLSEEGGLFLPESIPALDKSLKELSEMDYRQVAYEVMKLLLTDYTEEELKNCINRAYDSKFDCEEIVPLVFADGAYYVELFHGATIAFKDMALSILPHLLTTAAKKNNITDEIVILTATSGDTGKAALEGFDSVPGTRIVVFYPKGGVSFIQEKQMVTQAGANTKVVGIHGNFDDAQTGVKNIFGDKELKEELSKRGFRFSSANSINIGRLVPQIVYYVYSYAKLLAEGKLGEGEKINIVVPTGNFGNILAAYIAGQMGVPVHKLICASNENKVLYDFFKSGKYDKNREFTLTNSPSMDILISSNLERMIYIIAGEDAQKNRSMMADLSANGVYEITPSMKEKLSSFVGEYATEEETLNQIAKIYESTGYVLDTHTAVASCAYDKYVAATGDQTKTIIASTASPFKFVGSVMSAIAPETKASDDFSLCDELSKLSGVAIPKAVSSLKSAPVKHDLVVDIADMKQTVLDFLV